MRRRERFVRWLATVFGVRAVDVGLDHDGVSTPIFAAGTEIDKP